MIQCTYICICISAEISFVSKLSKKLCLVLFSTLGVYCTPLQELNPAGNTETHKHIPLFIDLRLRNCFRLHCQRWPLAVILFLLCFLTRMPTFESPQLVCFVIDHIILLRAGRRFICGSLLFMCAVYCEILPLVHSDNNKHLMLLYLFCFVLQGLGLVITGTMPVFNLTADGDSKVSREQLPVNELLVICFVQPAGRNKCCIMPFLYYYYDHVPVLILSMFPD